jgi:translocation and assembly module TamB
MTNTPNPQPDSQPDPPTDPQPQPPNRRRPWVAIGLTAGAVAVLVGAGGALWAWTFVHQRLSPLVSELLSDTLDRPVELGQVERVSLSRIQLGPSALPATADDEDELFLDSVEVRFNLLRTLVTRELDLHIQGDGANGYFAQDEERRWFVLDIELPEPDRDPFFQVRVGSVGLRQADLLMQPYEEDEETPIPAVSFSQVSGELLIDTVSVDRLDPAGEPTGSQVDSQQFRFDFRGNPDRGGDLRVRGAVLRVPGAEELVLMSSADGVDGVTPAATPTNHINLSIQGQDLVGDQVMAVLNAFLAQPLPITAVGGEVSGTVDLSIRPNQPIDMGGLLQIEGTDLGAAFLPQPFQDVDGQMAFRGSEIRFENVAGRYSDVAVTGDGTLNLETGYDLRAETATFTVEDAIAAFDFDLPVEASGSFRADIAVGGALDSPELSGNLISQGLTQVDRVGLAEVALAFTLDVPQLRIDQLRVIPQLGGTLIGQGSVTFGETPSVNLTAQGDDLPADDLGRLYGLPDTVTLGRLGIEAAVTGPFNDLQGQARWQAPGSDFPSRGTLILAGETLRVEDAVAQVAGGTVSGNGTLVGGLWNANVQGRSLELARLGVPIAGTGGGDFQLSGSLADLSLAGIQAQGNGFADLAGGRMEGTGTLANGLWNATVQGTGLQLAQFNSDLQGAASGQFRLSGGLADLSLGGIRAQGDLALTQGLGSFARFAPQLSALAEPLTATVAWDGRQVGVQQADTAGLSAQGVITPDLTRTPRIASWDLGLTAQGTAIDTLPLPLPQAIALSGLVDFDGRLTGSPAAPALAGNLGLTNFAVNNLAFEPRLDGEVVFTGPEGLGVNLAGARDEIRVTYGLGDRALAFRVVLDDAIAVGRTEGDLLLTQIENFPLTALNLPPGGVEGFGTVRGELTQANLTINLREGSLIGDVDLRRPGLGYLGVDRFAGNVRYRDGMASITGGEVQSGDSLYRLTGQFANAADPQLVGQIQVVDGKVQDVLAALQIFELGDLGRGLTPPDWDRPFSPEELATVLAAVGTGDPNASLENQLRRLAEIQALQDQAEAEVAAQPLPPLSELAGDFDGNITVTASRGRGVTADFDLAGDNWRWGSDLQADQVTARGQFQDGVLTLQPLRFAAAPGDDPAAAAAISLIGDVALNPEEGEPRTLRFQANRIPIQPLQAVLNLPVDIDGQLNANASLTGSIREPQARGLVSLVEGSINQTQVSSASAQFIYEGARLNFLSNLVVDDAVEDPEPLFVRGSVPYRFQFMDTGPTDDRLLVEVNVRDEGLALLNLLNNQVTWDSGQGQVQLRAEGRWPEGAVPDLQINGTARLENATLRAALLPDPLTEVNAEARFIDDRIVLDGLTGNFSQGQVQAAGSLPLFIPVNSLDADGDSGLPSDTFNQPLTVLLDQIAFQANGTAIPYTGQVNGRLVIGGSALLVGPQIGGEIQLSEGRITLPDFGTPGERDTMMAAAAPTRLGPAPPMLNNLQLNIGRNVQLSQGGILNLWTEGQLQVNGTFDNLEPDGEIRLTRGRVNLFTTQFRLIGSDNTAVFDPRNGLDPDLNIQLQAVVPEAQRIPGIASSGPFSSAEVAERRDFGGSLSALRTVRVRAEVMGPASQIFDNLILTSSPQRSEREIVTLISGGVLTALESTLGSVSGGGDGFQGLLTVAGSALLTTVQDFIGDTLSLSEFSLFPVTPGVRAGQPDEDREGSGLDIAAEIGFDITDTVSASVLKILTDDSAPEFNVRYRINDQFLLRGTTNLDNINQFILEYENRF